jgi:hypothetical protein
LKPAEDGSPNHFQADCFDVMKGYKWDLLIGHPVCRYLANSGALRLYIGGKKAGGIDLERMVKVRDGAMFFRRFFTEFDGPVCIENPIMHKWARDYVGLDDCPRQTIQPYDFGMDASKATQLWLRGLPFLKIDPKWRRSGKMVLNPETGKMVERWGNQTPSGQNKLGPSDHRATDRARTYQGIAWQMAAQWVPYLLSPG